MKIKELIAANTQFTAGQLELIRDCLCVASERPPRNQGELMRLNDSAKAAARDLYLAVLPLTDDFLTSYGQAEVPLIGKDA